MQILHGKIPLKCALNLFIYILLLQLIVEKSTE